MDNTGKIVAISLLAFGCVAETAIGAVIPLSPTGNEVVRLLPEAQRRIMSFPTYDIRLDALMKDREGGGKAFGDDGSRWRVSTPLALVWRTTDGEGGPWRIALGEDGSFANASVWWVEGLKPDVATNGLQTWKWTVPRPNLKLGRRYCWKVWSDVKCKEAHAHGSMMGGKCAICGQVSKVRESSVALFCTDVQPPSWISLEGRVKNIRDLGGWKTLDGRRVKQGMAFRGQGLNDNSPNGEAAGRNRLMVEDVIYLKEILGIKTDLDLRNERETAKMKLSPIGDGVSYIQRAAPLYDGIFKAVDVPDWAGAEGKRAMAANFRVFCDRKNYPIYFHCIGGADRTGSLAYVLNGVLGVSRHDLEVDWESTFYPELPEMKEDYTGPKYWRRKQYFDEGFGKYGDEKTPWNERIRLYLLDCGVTDEEITTFRDIMLEPAESPTSANAT